MLPQTTFICYLVDSSGKHEPYSASPTPPFAPPYITTDSAKVWAEGFQVFNRFRPTGNWDQLIMFKVEPTIVRKETLLTR